MMNNESFIYRLIFYNTKIEPILNIPLNSSTKPIFEIPEDTCFVTLNAIHLISKDEEQNNMYEKNIYFFILAKKVTFWANTSNNRYIQFFHVPNTGYSQIVTDHLGFDKEKDLKKILNYLIKIFKDADVQSIDKDLDYSKNRKLKRFEKSLIRILNSNGI